MRKLFVFLLTGLILAGSMAARAEEPTGSEADDLWIKARIVTAYTLNRHLNPFVLSVDVKGGVATISGAVESSIERDLAGEIAKANGYMVELDICAHVWPPPKFPAFAE